MKYKLKKFLKLNIFVLGMLIFLTNCQTEDLVLKNESITKSKAIVTKLNYGQFLQQQNVKSTVEKLKKIELTKISNSKNRSNTQRSVVTIDSSSINQIINEDITSYTFKVINNDLESNTFENLVIQTDSNQQTSAYLIKYTPSISLVKGIPFQGIKVITPLDSNTTINTSNKTTVCVTITIYYNHYLCDPGVIESPETCDYTHTTEESETSCETLSDGPSYSTVFYPNTGGSGGGANSNNNDPNYDGSDPNIHGNGGTPVNTAPLFDEEEIEMISPEDLCNDLASKDANPDFINYMADLKTRAASQGFESAYTMFQNASLGLQFSPRYDGSLQDPVVDIGVGFTDTSADLNSIGAIHCHLDNGTTFKIFSFEDIIALAKFADISTRPTPEFGIYVVTSSGTFCLKIKNKIQLKQMLSRMIGIQDYFEKSFAEKVKTSDSLDKQILGFLKFLKQNHFGNILELYKKNETNNVWQKQELNSNESAANPTNC